MPHVAVVICSFNGREDTLECLESFSHVSWDPLTTIVVDNASDDGTAEAVGEAYPDSPVVRTERNLGATGGYNAGMRRALELGADYVLPINNDTLVDPEIVAELVAAAESRPDAGALSPIIYWTEPPDMIWYAGAGLDPRKGYYRKMTGYGERDEQQYAGVREVDAMSTTAVLVPRRVIEEVGLLDDPLFVHIEDFEWSLRMRRAGFKVYCVSAAKMWHKVSHGSGGEHSPTIAYYAVRNTLAVSERYAPLGGLGALRRRLVTLAVHAVHARRGRRPLENLRAVFEGFRDFRHGRLGPRGQTAT